MNNEEKILSSLEAIATKVSAIDSTLVTLQALVDTRFDRLEEKVDAVFEQTANLTEFKTQTNHEISDIRAAIKQTLYDVTMLKTKVQ